MSNFKRSHGSTSKSGNSPRAGGGKPKEGLKMTTTRKSLDLGNPSPKSECRSMFPYVKSSDNNRVLPRYTAVLSRTTQDGVGMEDLDQLQQDLEKLLSTATVRHRMLKSEIESFDRGDDRRKNKKGPTSYDKTQPSKRRREEKSKFKELKNPNRLMKARHVPVNNFVSDLSIKREVPKVIFPKNDTFDKFWMFIEPYCTNVTKESVQYLDELLQECSQDINVKIPEVGEHYTMEWSDDLLNSEYLSDGRRATKSSRSFNFSNELKRNGLNAMVDTFSSPLTQRFLAALLEDNVVTDFPKVNDKLKPSDFSFAKTGNFPKNGICMDRRLRKELVELGILDVEDLSNNVPPDDEILTELKRCMEELRTVNEKNLMELNKLRTIVAKDLRRQEIKEVLDKVDDQVMDLYNKILVTKQTQNQQSDDESYSKFICAKQNLDEYEEEANKVVHQQNILHKELTELSNAIIPS